MSIVGDLFGGLFGGGEQADTSGINKAAVDSAKVGADTLAFYQKIWNEQAPDRAAAQTRANAVSDAQLGAMNFATDQAKELDAYNKSTFRPMEQQVVADAQNYDTADRRAGAMATARADVESSMGAAQQGLTRDLARRGASMGSGRSLALMQDAALQKGAAVAGATTKAAQQVEQQGYARKMDAVGLGRGVVGNQATQQQIATSQGNSAVGSSNAGLSALQSGNGLMAQGASSALNGYNTAGNLYGQVAQINQASNASTMQGIGGLAQLGTQLYMSDEAIKTKTGKPANADKALAEVNALKVEDGWEYDPAKGGPDDGGMPHTGPMAQNVRAVMGNKAAPGGKAIDIVTMNGKLIASMQELTKRVKQLEKAA